MLRTHKHWLPVLLWMGFIFLMSTDLGSSKHTGQIIEPILRWLKPDITPKGLDLAHLLVRKCGHLTEYAVLALLTLRAFRISLRVEVTGRHLRAAAFAWLIATGYAATDEYHQTFVPDRTPAVHDVVIDSTGALIALTVAVLWHKHRNKRSPAP